MRLYLQQWNKKKTTQIKVEMYDMVYAILRADAAYRRWGSYSITRMKRLVFFSYLKLIKKIRYFCKFVAFARIELHLLYNFLLIQQMQNVECIALNINHYYHTSNAKSHRKSATMFIIDFTIVFQPLQTHTYIFDVFACIQMILSFWHSGDIVQRYEWRKKMGKSMR